MLFEMPKLARLAIGAISEFSSLLVARFVSLLVAICSLIRRAPRPHSPSVVNSCHIELIDILRRDCWAPYNHIELVCPKAQITN